MKITISYQDHELPLVTDLASTLRALFPVIRQHESQAQPDYRITYFTVKTPANKPLDGAPLL